ncbi:TPA: YSIRK-type signal peptide-containing protein [Streptococcus pneumoniae]|nr:IgA-binding beta antigen [Streptococcus pneumoniae]CIT22778.1 IgA-binding beta antigen [Streptococcus pneumoniae]CIW66586.1 IgA-binding beta antigen [Streptococcus pneumoniae]CIW93413.1 IgA-binding beta antigen [Streptococcus pneumoniae]COJ12629.1 IgA-binding beta antigen [Streptococcus pneumoniae]
MRARHERRNRYSIRKFSVGVASVVVATFFCVGGGGQVVQAADGTRSQGVSSGLDIYRKDLQAQLQNLHLSEQDRTKYEKEIKNGDQTSLDQLRALFTKLQDQQAQEAIDKAKIALPSYMSTRLEELDQSGFTFSTLLKHLMEVVKEYSKLFDDAPNRKSVEELEKKAREIMDGYITEYQKTLTPGLGTTDEGAPQPGSQASQAGKGEQAPQAGKGEQAGQASQAGKGEQAPQAGKGEQAGQASQAGDKGKPADDVGKPSPRNQTFTGTVGSVNVTVLFDKPVNAEKVTVKEITEKDLVDKISRQAGGGSIRLFDLSLTKDGKETHVNEERTVRLALEGLGENVQVYHVKPDGQLELLDSKVEDGHVIFRINHFSLFAIKTMSTKSNQETPSNQATPSAQAKSTPKETTKDATSKKTLPNTGTADSTALLAAAASTAILGLGLAGRRRKED